MSVYQAPRIVKLARAGGLCLYVKYVILFLHLGQCMWRVECSESYPEIIVFFFGRL